MCDLSAELTLTDTCTCSDGDDLAEADAVGHWVQASPRIGDSLLSIPLVDLLPDVTSSNDAIRSVRKSTPQCVNQFLGLAPTNAIVGVLTRHPSDVCFAWTE